MKSKAEMTELRMEVAGESLALLESNGISVARLKTDLATAVDGWHTLKKLAPMAKQVCLWMYVYM